VISAEEQRWVFLRAGLLGGRGDLPLLSSAGGQRWLNQAEAVTLRDELAKLAAGDLAADDLLDAGKALALVEYSLVTGTGVSLVPPE